MVDLLPGAQKGGGDLTKAQRGTFPSPLLSSALPNYLSFFFDAVRSFIVIPLTYDIVF